MIPEAVHRSPGMCLTAEENPGTSARRPSDEQAARPVIASNEVPYLQIMPVGSQSTSGREKKGKLDVGRLIIHHIIFDNLTDYVLYIKLL